MLHDLKVAVRRLRRAPAFTGSAFATLALGIASLISILTVLDAVVLEDLPYPRAGDLVDVSSSVPNLGFERWEVTEAGYVHFVEHARTLDAVGAYRVGALTVEREGDATRVAAAQITPTLFTVLGARPAVGRLFGGRDVAPGATRAAMIHHDYWVARYGADTAVVGTSIRANGVEWEIVGVLSSGVDLPEDHADVWLPLSIDPADPDADSHSLRAIGRRAIGATLGDVRSELTRLTSQFSDRFPNEYSGSWMAESGFRTVVQDLSAKVVGVDVRRALWILFAAAVVILVIATVNVLNLFLVRNVDRHRELSLRHALGARSGSIFRHFAAEAVLLTLTATATGVGLAQLALVPIRGVAVDALPRLDAVALDASVVTAALLIALLIAVVLGTLPLWSFRTSAVRQAMAEAGTRSTGGRGQRTLRAALVAGQLALALMLLNGAGLLIQSFRQLSDVDPGFRPQGVVAVDLSLAGSRYRDQEAVHGFYRNVLDGVRAIPGVVEAGAVTSLPLEPGLGCYSLAIEARPLGEGEPAPCIDVYVATPGYFEALGVSLADGRWFAESDNTPPTGPAVVTRTLAERLWPSGAPLGQGVSIHGYRAPWLRVVGVTGPMLAAGLDAPPVAAVFLPMVSPEGAREFLGHRAGMTLVARTTLDDPTVVVGAIRASVANVDPAIAVANPRRVDRVVAAARADTALAAMLLAFGAVVALLLGAVGVYGVVAQNLTSRTPEIGVRMALGATGNTILRLVLRTSLRPLTAGVALGVAGAWASAGVLGNLLFGVDAVDPLNLAAVALVLVGVGTAAILLVARRAVAIDPASALRVE